jgi:hypothetical protein
VEAGVSPFDGIVDVLGAHHDHVHLSNEGAYCEGLDGLAVVLLADEGVCDLGRLEQSLFCELLVEGRTGRPGVVVDV